MAYEAGFEHYSKAIYFSISDTAGPLQSLINSMDLLTPWSRVLPQKLKHPKLLKKFPAFYGI